MEFICDRCGKKIGKYELLCKNCERWLEEHVAQLMEKEKNEKPNEDNT